MHRHPISLLALTAVAAGSGCVLGTDAGTGPVPQGQQIQGQQIQGQQIQGQQIHGFHMSGVTLSGEVLQSVQIIDAELVAKRADQSTVRGRDLIGAQLTGELASGEVLSFRISNVVSADDPGAALEPSDPGPIDDFAPPAPELGPFWHPVALEPRTYLYYIEQCLNCDDTSTGVPRWAPACSEAATEPYFKRWAVPVAAVWKKQQYRTMDGGSFIDEAARTEVRGQFTFGCLSGAIGKCLSWGYRPGESDHMRDMHAACVRMARADYCGNGESHTTDGTWIDIADDSLTPSRHQLSGEAPPGSPPLLWNLEAYWGPRGAYCGNHARITTYPGGLAGICGGSTSRYGAPWATCDEDDLASHNLPAAAPVLLNYSDLNFGFTP